MTAYGAVLSLKNTIDYILHSSYLSLAEPSLHILPAHNQLQPLQQILERLDSTSKSKSRKKVNELDGRIKDKIWEFEDKLEILLYQQILPQLPAKQVDQLSFSIDLQSLRDEVPSFIETLKDMEKEYIYELDNMVEDDEADCSVIGFNRTGSKMIGLSDDFEDVKTFLMGSSHWNYVYGLVGTAGVGKTTLAMEIYQDVDIMSHFECRAWVTVGRKPQLTQLLQGIVAQLCGDDQKNIGEYFKGKDWLVIVDDVWEPQVLDYLISSIRGMGNGLIRFLVTTRAQKVISDTKSPSISGVVRFLNEEESKDLLCHKVFGGKDLCPPQLDKAATKIAKKCEGLPLMIVAVADILSVNPQNRDPEYWDDVAKPRSAVFTDAYNEISKVLYPSYDYLPQYLKMPFLYMGVFPIDYVLPPSKIVSMFFIGGWFLDTNKTQSFQKSVWKCLKELCRDMRLVLFTRKNIHWDYETMDLVSIFKTCSLHSSWRHLCREEARKNRFYQVLYRLVDGSEECVGGQRGLCLENNILFGIKEFCESVRLHCALTTRSLLFFGPYHQYPTPIDVGFKLLRELDALQLRFYTFPTEILTLVLLKYLALTCNGELPTTISKLFNLRILIVHPHMSIRRGRAPPCVPIQIWDMQELEHIEILGHSLLVPYDVASLEKLSTLVGVNANIGNILELSRRIPNVRKLVVHIELTPFDDHSDLLSCFPCISTLGSLETLKCSIINPVLKYGHVVPMAPSPLMLPCGLKKLHLSGMGFPWEYMDVIGALPLLQVLKLRSYAFRGSKWEAQEGSFLKLEVLLIEDTDLVCMTSKSRIFRKLNFVSLKSCYKLEVFHLLLFDYTTTEIELVDCNPLAVTWFEQFQPPPYSRLDVTASSSFDDKPMTIKFERKGNKCRK